MSAQKTPSNPPISPPTPSAIPTIPPPPPLPPPPVRQSAPSPSTAALIKQHFARPDRPQTSTIPTPTAYKPSSWFFYGTLTDPVVLQSILSLPDLPTLHDGSIRNHKVKMWGIYPALVPSPGSTVRGMVYEVETWEQVERLRRYETGAYEMWRCVIEVERGMRIEEGWTFGWAGERGSRELEEGGFDLERFRRYFRKGVVGKEVVGWEV